MQAAQIEERGMLDKKERSHEMWKRLALNEAAMAVVAANFPDMKNIEFVMFTLILLHYFPFRADYFLLKSFEVMLLERLYLAASSFL